MRHHTCTYQADGGRQPLVQAFLGGGSGSSRPNENTVVVVAGASRTCRTLGQGVGLISSPPVHTEGSPSPS
jgi:hypothetical protein